MCPLLPVCFSLNQVGCNQAVIDVGLGLRLGILDFFWVLYFFLVFVRLPARLW